MATITIRQGDSLPAISTVIEDSYGNPMNLTGSSVSFVMRTLTSNTPVINNSSHVQIVVPTTGLVQYNWQSGDTANAGIFQCEWRVTTSSAATYTFPNDGYQEVSIEESLASVGGGTLVALGDLKDYLQIPTGDTSHDAELMRFIYGVQPVVENLVGCVVQQTFNEWYDGGQYWVRLRHRPVYQLMAVSEYRGPIEYPLSIIPSPDFGAIYSCMLDTGDRITRRSTGGGIIAFPAMPNSVHVVYVAGRATVPQNIRMGTLELIRVNWQQTQQGDRPAFGGDMMGQDTVPDGEQLNGFLVSPRVRELLVPNRKHPSLF